MSTSRTRFIGREYTIPPQRSARPAALTPFGSHAATRATPRVTLLWIICATLAGALLSIFGAALLSFTAFSTVVPRMVSYAVGAMLGAAFLQLLPEAFRQAESIEALFATTLGGLLGFFLLEKAALWRHHQHGEGGAHDHAHADAHK